MQTDGFLFVILPKLRQRFEAVICVYVRLSAEIYKPAAHLGIGLAEARVGVDAAVAVRYIVLDLNVKGVQHAVDKHVVPYVSGISARNVVRLALNIIAVQSYRARHDHDAPPRGRLRVRAR